MKLSFGSSKPISGMASIIIKANFNSVFNFIAANFFNNYQKWASEVIEVEPLDNSSIVAVGVKARQVREDNGTVVDSTFEIIEYSPYSTFILQGLTAPYKQTYLMEGCNEDKETKLTFIFDLLEIELFMRPFEKLIRMAIEDGADNTVENICALLTPPNNAQLTS